MLSARVAGGKSMMQSVVMAGRLVSRALANGIYNLSSQAEPSLGAATATKGTKGRVVSAVSGFPKDQVNAKCRKGQFGDDSWFIARYKTADVMGVADGVGGWRRYGIDPGDFSFSLMKACERLVTNGGFRPSNPATLLARSYHELLESKQQILGSSTACVLVFSREEQLLYAANIGDSGFLVVRRGKVIHRSLEQQHYFNTPFQLALPPPGQSGLVLSDSPESADRLELRVEDGDVILLATDGVFDNVPDHMLVTEMTKLQGERDPARLQGVANAIAWMARSLAFDDEYMSPFALSARQNGIQAIGGKPDDVTVLLATVAL